MNTMKAFRLMDWEQAPQFDTVAVPEVTSDSVLVRVSAVGLCHSDLSMQSIPKSWGEMIGWSMPFTLGHEVAGVVEAVGSEVDTFVPGDRVAVASTNPCTKCWYCIRGEEQNCLVRSGRGFGADGGLAEFVKVSSMAQLVKLHSIDAVAAAPLTDAGATAYHGVQRIMKRLYPEMTAVVLGAGGLGAYAIQLISVLSGSRIIAVDQSPQRLEVAKRLGAKTVLHGVGESTVQEILELTGGRGADAVLDFVGIDATISAGIEATARGGSFGLVGAAGGGLEAGRGWFGSLPRDGEVFTFQGSSLGDLRGVLALAERGLIESPVETFGFDEVASGYQKLTDGTLTGRAVVTMPVGMG